VRGGRRWRLGKWWRAARDTDIPSPLLGASAATAGQCPQTLKTSALAACQEIASQQDQ